ncbi:MAG: hypothetical protein DI630_29345 [Gordonia sp. (in: high G+C Gram-positive bacteria)]|nr:MAG: hypothetical protein DI630_29345 [Gordonia sp. (in: high G+C Gram-positive bacteria)]
MPINLKKINPGKSSHLLQPRDIFAAIPDKPWPRLRPEQGEVLKTWFERRNEKDLVIKQNTGGGKTLVGLLIAQSSLNEGIGPAIYLVPDTFLISQVVEAANEVGIPVCEDARDDKFLTSRSILVTTFPKLVNGRSTFGVHGYKNVTRIGTVIVDDAHSALSSARNQFTASLPSDHRGYSELLSLFANDLKQQSPKNYANLEAGDYSAPLRVTPSATVEKAYEALQILNKYGDDDANKTIYFAWPFIADNLALSVFTFTDKTVEIRTPCPQIDLIPAFSQARRRVYLTATLDDEGILVTELDADVKSITTPITPERASDLGDRLILAPLSINPDLPETSIRVLARDFADGRRRSDREEMADRVNVVVLVPSNKAVDAWRPYADEILHVNDMRPIIKRMTEGHHVGVVVLVNKYDGIDLPGDACRLLIIDGIPTPLTPSEQREAAALIGSRTFEARKIQRIEQGMGRGIRDLEDYSAVLLMTRDAALTLRDRRLQALYSPATRAQIELSQELSDQIENEGIGEIRNALNMFLDRDQEWVETSLATTADVEYERAGRVEDIAIARRQAFNATVARDIPGGIEKLRQGIDSVADALEKGWHLEELAGYQQLEDPAASQKTLHSARSLNSGVLKPSVPRPLKPVKGPALQGLTASSYLAGRYSDATELRLGFGSLFDNIVWGLDETAALAEEQIRLLGLHLGFASTRPEKEHDNGGPDNLWGLTPTTNAVIELKTEVRRPDASIIKSEAGQLLSSLEWNQAANPDVPQRVPVLLHPGHVLHHQASLPADTRVITPTDLIRLRDSCIRWANELAQSSSWSNPTAVADGLKRHRLTADQVILAHSSKVAKA